jgi:CrcB protein
MATNFLNLSSSILYIGVLGVLGIFSRYFFIVIFEHFSSLHNVPFATICVNILGSFLIGIVYVMGVERLTISPELRVGILVGFLGGFTTFSSYSFEGFRLFEQQRYLAALTYLGLSPLLGVACTFAAVLLSRKYL